MYRYNEILADRLAKLKNYRFYYGEVTSTMMEEAKQYELLIVNPSFFTKENVKELQQHGVLMIGYIDVVEIEVADKRKNLTVRDEDYYKIEKDRVYYWEQDAYLMDMTSPYYRAFLLEEVKQQIHKKGFDGILLNTIQTMEDEFLDNPTEWKKQAQGYVHFLQQVRSRYPHYFVMQNGGLSMVHEHSYPYIDGVMWEGLHYKDAAEDADALKAMTKLYHFHKKKDLSVFTVSYMNKIKNTQLAKRLGFKHYHEKGDYDTW
jgi:polysaccharide biosynthesis protein PelA